jgi:hypothetical protein
MPTDPVTGPLPLIGPATMPWRFGRYPRVDAATLKERIALFGVDMRQHEADARVSAYLADRQANSSVTKRAVVLISLVLVVTQIVWAREFREQVVVGLSGWTAWMALAGLVVVLLVVDVGTRVRTPGLWHRMRGPERAARNRFFLRTGMTFAAGYHVVVTQNLIGLAARRLFVSLQRRRWTWASPPAVADRALRLSQPLLDIAVEDGDGRALFSFLNDVVIVVVAGREDLIPAVRARYTMIPRRSGETGEISERDILYLDPMRNRGRWEVVKDFVLPLASWVSLVVSVIALVVAVAK